MRKREAWVQKCRKVRWRRTVKFQEEEQGEQGTEGKKRKGRREGLGHPPVRIPIERCTEALSLAVDLHASVLCCASVVQIHLAWKGRRRG
jgi:hypothetical protein